MLAANSNASIEACLEPEAVRRLLQQALPDVAAGRVTIECLRVTNARRNASRRRNPNPLTLRYELDVHDTTTGAVGTRQYYGKVFRDGASARAVHGTPALHLPQLDMLLWAWPADPGLPQLPNLLDLRETRRWWGEPAHKVCALRYEPEQRATLRYTRVMRGMAPEHLFVKTFNDGRGEAIHRRFAHFWDLARHDTRAPQVARPLGYCAATRAFWRRGPSARRCCMRWRHHRRRRCPAGWRRRSPRCTPRHARSPGRCRATPRTGSPKFAAGARRSPAPRPNSPTAPHASPTQSSARPGNCQ